MKRVISILLCAWWAIASSSADDWSGNLTFSVEDITAFNGCMGTIRSAASPRSIGAATLAAARYFVGRPYVASTLEREPERLVINLREWDCTTLVESAVALARTAQSPAPTFDVYLRELSRLRYRTTVTRRCAPTPRASTCCASRRPRSPPATVMPSSRRPPSRLPPATCATATSSAS